MANTYIKLPLTSSSGGGTGGTSTDITNESSVSGTTVTDALNNINTDVTTIESESSATQYIPQPNITLTATDISNKYVTLSDIPTEPNKTTLSIVGGVPQTYGIDFEVVGNQLSWNGLALDGELEAGDVLIIAFN